MPRKPNYSFEKKLKEAAKQKRKAAKRDRKAEKKTETNDKDATSGASPLDAGQPID